jgi:hypothetical protein
VEFFTREDAADKGYSSASLGWKKFVFIPPQTRIQAPGGHGIASIPILLSDFRRHRDYKSTKYDHDYETGPATVPGTRLERDLRSANKREDRASLNTTGKLNIRGR